jgi:5-methylcytosine-specific restriction endonuclease McrA
MPCNYKDYPANWFTEIRPNVLERAGNRCEFCGVLNYEYVYRGTLDGVEIYQTLDGSIFRADDGTYIATDFGADIEPASKKQLAIKVILTVAHLDHDISNNDYSNLRALCQQCHLRYDAKRHKRTRKYGNSKLQGELI